MAFKDYYVVLGVPRTESPRGVRQAFRDLARRHHPDLAGPGGTPAFREVVEAYRVLSDPDQRRAHDARLRQRERGPRVRVSSAAPPRTGTPLGRIDLFAEPGAIQPSAEALLERILRNFTGLGVPKAEHREPLLCDVVLEPEEALGGGLLPIRIPVVGPCPACHGSGGSAFFPCLACDARGALSSEVVVPLEIPPGVRPGTILQLPLEDWGIANLWLRARIDVQP